MNKLETLRSPSFCTLMIVLLIVILACDSVVADHGPLLSPFLNETRMPYGVGNNQQPLEIKMAALTDDIQPQQLVVFSLYNQAPGSNILAAHVLDAPFDGTSPAFFDIIDNGPLFAVGDGCRLDQTTAGRQVLFPYIDGTTMKTARFDGASWVTASPVGTTLQFDSADCGRVSDGIIISAHRFEPLRIELFHSVDGINFNQVACVGGTSDCLLGDSNETSDDIFGPSQGAIRDTLLTDAVTRVVNLMYQRRDGTVFYSEIDTATNTLARNCPLQTLAPPSGVFDGVHESAASLSLDTNLFTFTYSPSNDNIYAGGVPAVGCPPLPPLLLGSQETGGPLGFQGGAIHSGGVSNSSILWGDYFVVENIDLGPGGSLVVQELDDYPGSVSDGPRAGCVLIHNPPAEPPHPEQIVGASSHPAGGVNLYGFYGEVIHDDRFEPIPFTFGTCP